MLRLRHSSIMLDIDPDRGAGVTRLAWRGTDIFRQADLDATSPLALSCFALVPFSNRIAGGHFAFDGRKVSIAPNVLGGTERHPLHGFGWLARWQVEHTAPDRATLVHQYDGAEWLGPYRAAQSFVLRETGIDWSMTLANMSAAPMPVGLGLHPYFPRAGAALHLDVAGCWDVDDDRLPTQWRALDAPPAWFEGGTIDTVFTGRIGPVVIDWPTHRLTMTPDTALAETVVYVPEGGDAFCVEPVSHATDAVNRGGMRVLSPGATWQVAIGFDIAARS
jgi:aldose 1-epimerase